jgi:EAL domain-containing protein (putative c-di-GMP-specific phosphodiesterase class I)
MGCNLLQGYLLGRPAEAFCTVASSLCGPTKVKTA